MGSPLKTSLSDFVSSIFGFVLQPHVTVNTKHMHAKVKRPWHTMHDRATNMHKKSRGHVAGDKQSNACILQEMNPCMHCPQSLHHSNRALLPDFNKTFPQHRRIAKIALHKKNISGR